MQYLILQEADMNLMATVTPLVQWLCQLSSTVCGVWLNMIFLSMRYRLHLKGLNHSICYLEKLKLFSRLLNFKNNGPVLLLKGQLFHVLMQCPRNSPKILQVITKGQGVRATTIRGPNAFAPSLCFT